MLFIAVYKHALLRDCSALLAGGASYYDTVPLASYNPKGLVQLFTSAPPPAWFVSVVVTIANWSTLAAIIGLFTRSSMILSVLSVSFLLGLSFSWEPYWSHGSNVVMLAGIAMMFGRAGDYLSFDYVIRRYWLNWPASRLFRDGSYWWPVLLAQIAVALFYFAGFFAKVTGPDWDSGLSWVFSDNLRNSLLRPLMIFDREVPWQVLVVASSPFLWKLVAAGHLANQALPLCVIAATHKPRVRLIEGLVFAAGAPLLGIFMGFWNPYWMLLAAFFVDWDYFIGPKLEDTYAFSSGDIIPNGKDTDATAKLAPTYRAACLTFIAAFLLFDASTFLFRLSPVHKMYPFSWMGFYSSVEARPPYDWHQPYTIPSGQLLLHRKGAVEDIVSLWQLTSLYLPAFTNAPELERRADAVKAVEGLLEPYEHKPYDLNGRSFDVGGWDRIDLNAALIQIPAYPRETKRTIAHAALVASLDRRTGVIKAAGARQAMDPATGGTALTIETIGFEHPEISLFYRPDPWTNGDGQPLLPLPGAFRDNGFVIDEEKLDLPRPSWTPIVIRVREKDQMEMFDFFGPVLYR
ncbi:hypothetical protein [Bradyrhizobium brasilense]|uniref:HTTM domain-containing protein n=1 Tax=Bradyrhizobium brasilense TaxID=1419277 RepID=A0ABY8JQW3_9BRAD|nr:hypothetical protein [Bradyrhizobium brasilense]WFU66720.1 hypothetical protein QA636_14925 [Bradyrhizobium brasilense]